MLAKISGPFGCRSIAPQAGIETALMPSDFARFGIEARVCSSGSTSVIPKLVSDGSAFASEPSQTMSSASLEMRWLSL